MNFNWNSQHNPNIRRFVVARCKHCGFNNALPRAAVKFQCGACGEMNKTGMGKYGNPLALRTNCIQCGWNFALEPADYCTNPLHRLAHEQAKKEAADRAAASKAKMVEWAGTVVKIVKGPNGKWRFENE